MKGLILAGGLGTRLEPVTHVVNKHFIPVFDKPMIYYPLTTLILAGVDDICIVTNPDSKPLFQKLLGDGEKFGVSIKYEIQENPLGIVDGIRSARKFIGKSEFLLILGDNIFIGPGFGRNLAKYFREKGCHIFVFPVSNPEEYGILTFDQNFKPESIIEKPLLTKSKLAVSGLYFFDSRVHNFLDKVNVSQRGEFEITELLNFYLEESELHAIEIPRGSFWIDAGTFENVFLASELIRVLSLRQGMEFGNPEVKIAQFD